MRATLPLLILAGCPFIFDEDSDSDAPLADRPGLDDPTADADTDVDADTDADSDADTDTDPTRPGTGETGLVEEGAPRVTSLEVQVLWDAIVLEFTLEDDDGDLDGGSLAWSDDGVNFTALTIGGQLDTWNSANGEGTLVLPGIDRVCGKVDIEETFTLRPTDAAGLTGADADVDMTVDVHDLDSVDRRSSTIGVVTAPALICGTIEEIEDEDPDPVRRFTHEPGGTWELTLDSEDGRDVDVTLEDLSGKALLGGPDTQDPDFMGTVTLASGADYLLRFERDGSESDADFVLMFHE